MTQPKLIGRVGTDGTVFNATHQNLTAKCDCCLKRVDTWVRFPLPYSHGVVVEVCVGCCADVRSCLSAHERKTRKKEEGLH